MKQVINLNEKQDIILKYIRDGKSQRKISKETGLCRETIRKYVKEYESKLQEVNGNLDEIHKIDIINDITNSPKYTVANSSKRVVTYEVIERIKFYLKENEQKRLTGRF